MHHFNESHQAFSGFSKYYSAEILPQLTVWEDKRKRKKLWIVPTLVLSTVFCAVAIYWAIFSTQSKASAFLIALIVTFCNPIALYHLFFNAFKADVKDFLVKKVCHYTGLQYTGKTHLVLPIKMFKAIRFFPRSYQFSRSEDHITGYSKGISFEAVEVHGLTGYKKHKTQHTSMLFKFNLSQFAEGNLVVLRKGDPKPDKKMKVKPVGFAAPPFSHMFDVYGDDQVLSRFILHPVFLERILYAERVIDGINARFAVSGSILWVCVETANRFEQGSMWTSFANPRRTQFLIWEVSSVLKIVDGLVDLLLKPGRVSQERKAS